MGLRVEREDVEDQPAAVDDLVLSRLSRLFCWARATARRPRRGCRSRSRSSPGAAPRPCPCPRTSWGRRGGGSATRRPRRRRPPWSPARRARSGCPRRSSPGRRRCRRRAGRPSRRAGRGRSSLGGSWQPQHTRRAPPRYRVAETDSSTQRRDRRASPGRRSRRRPRGRARAGTTSPGGARTATFRCASAATASSSVQLAVEVRPALAVADRPRTTAGAGSKRSRSARASSTRPASNWARARSRDAPPVLAGLDDELEAEDRRPVADAARAAARRRGASRSRGRATTRRGLRRSVRAARVGASAVAAARRAPRRRRAPVAPRSPRARPRRAGARPCRSRHHGPQPEAGPAGEDPDATPLAQRPRAPPARGRGSRRPSTPRRAPRGRCRGGRPGPAPPASPWPSRCRGRGTPAASRRTRSRPGSPAREQPLRERDGEAGLAGRGRPADDDERRRRRGHGRARAQASVPRSAYGPACSTRTRTRRPTRSGEPATCTSLFSRDRPARWTTPSGRRANASRDSAAPSASSSSWSCSFAAARRCRRGPRSSRPTHARLRSSPIASWSASSPIEAAALLGGGHVVGEARRRRPGPLAVRRREDLVVADGLEQPERRLVLGLGLAAEPDDDVGRERDARDRLADPRRGARGSARSCTGGPSGGASSRTRLDRQVEGLAHRRAVAHRLDQPVRQVPRVRGHEPQARDRGRAVGGAQPVDGADQLGEVRAGRRGPGAGRRCARCGRARSAARARGRGRSG